MRLHCPHTVLMKAVVALSTYNPGSVTYITCSAVVSITAVIDKIRTILEYDLAWQISYTASGASQVSDLAAARVTNISHRTNFNKLHLWNEHVCFFNGLYIMHKHNYCA